MRKKRISLNSAARRPEVRAKHSLNNSGSGNPMFGRTHSEQARNKIRNARLGSKASEQTKSKMSNKRKGCLNPAYNPIKYRFSYLDFAEFELTAYEFRKFSGISQSFVSMLISGKRKIAKGWKLCDQKQ